MGKNQFDQVKADTGTIIKNQAARRLRGRTIWHEFSTFSGVLYPLPMSRSLNLARSERSKIFTPASIFSAAQTPRKIQGWQLALAVDLPFFLFAPLPTIPLSTVAGAAAHLRGSPAARSCRTPSFGKPSSLMRRRGCCTVCMDRSVALAPNASPHRPCAGKRRQR